jgi:hypothetical protein
MQSRRIRHHGTLHMRLGIGRIGQRLGHGSFVGAIRMVVHIVGMMLLGRLMFQIGCQLVRILAIQHFHNVSKARVGALARRIDTARDRIGETSIAVGGIVAVVVAAAVIAVVTAVVVVLSSSRCSVFLVGQFVCGRRVERVFRVLGRHDESMSKRVRQEQSAECVYRNE